MFRRIESAMLATMLIAVACDDASGSGAPRAPTHPDASFDGSASHDAARDVATIPAANDGGHDAATQDGGHGDAEVSPWNFAIAARDVLAGVCFLEPLFHFAERSECTAPYAYDRCADEQCNATACDTDCHDYVACAANVARPCDSSCAISDACSACLGHTVTCVEGACLTKIQCASSPDAGGACEHIRSCCDSLPDSGLEHAGCLQLLELGKIGGETLCKQAINDPGSYCFVPCVAVGSPPAGDRPECAGLPASMQRDL